MWSDPSYNFSLFIPACEWVREMELDPYVMWASLSRNNHNRNCRSTLWLLSMWNEACAEEIECFEEGAGIDESEHTHGLTSICRTSEVLSVWREKQQQPTICIPTHNVLSITVNKQAERRRKKKRQQINTYVQCCGVQSCGTYYRSVSLLMLLLPFFFSLSPFSLSFARANFILCLLLFCCSFLYEHFVGMLVHICWLRAMKEVNIYCNVVEEWLDYECE